VCSRELPSQKAVGPQVLQEIGQAVEPPVAHRVIKRPSGRGTGFEDATSRVGEVQATNLFRASALIDLEDWQGVCAAAQVPTGGVGGAARSPDGQDLGACGAHRTHECRPAHAQGREQLRRR